jgi:cytochrome c-type biogenesis protein CcmF
MYFLAVVLVGTTYPIFLEVISSEKISVGPPFYNKLIIPFLVPLLFVMAIGPKLKWIKSNIENKSYLILFFIISLMLSVLIVRNLETNFLFNTVLVTAAFYLLFTTLREFFNKKMINPSQNLAHFSFSLLILSILFNNIFSFEIVTNLRVNEIYESEKYKISFESIEQKNKQNFKTIIGKFTVEQVDGDVDVMRPELRIYNQPNIVTSEADIKINIFYDKFMTMNYVQNQDYFNIRYQFKPFMFWIWVSTLMLSLSGLLSFAKRKYEK